LTTKVTQNAPSEKIKAAAIPISLMNPRKKLLVPRKTPAKKLGKAKNLGFGTSISVK
jgi:hypothetical protein